MERFRTGGAFDSPTFAELVASVDTFRFAPGHRVDDFVIIEPLGRGGTGEVYLAERSREEFTQRVALKLARPDLVSPELEDTLHSERRILADLTHPSIAGLVDGGVTEEGLPFFAMEFVEGDAIDEYVDKSGLSLDGRVRLVITVLEALQYAHSRLIIHRDIKPSNIKVDRAGHPIILDFGIAKLVAGDGPPAELTSTGQRMFTPRFAAPEQLAGTYTSVGTDVYQVGLLLYHLLTGLHYGDRATARRDKATDDDLTPIHEWPSQRAATQLADRSRSDASRIRKYLSGDLSAVLYKALARPVEDRYRTAQAFADDLRALLDGAPVRARAWTWRYRGRLWVKKHRSALAVGAVSVAALGVGLALYIHQIADARAAAQAEARRANQVTEYISRVFERLDPLRQVESAPTLLALVEASHAEVRAEMNDPVARATLLGSLARLYVQAGQYDKAEQLSREALALLKAAEEPGRVPERALARSHHGLGYVLLVRRKLSAALEHLERAETVFGREPDEDRSGDSLRNLRSLGFALASQPEQVEVARSYYERYLNAVTGSSDRPVTLVASAYRRLGAFETQHGDRLLAERYWKRAEKVLSDAGIRDTPEYWSLQMYLAQPERNRGEFAAAIARLEPTYAAQLEYFGPGHEETRSTLDALARTELAGGYLAQAIPHLDTLRQLDIAAYGESHPWVASDWAFASLALFQVGRWTEARRAAKAALDILRTTTERVEFDIFPSIAEGLGRWFAETGDVDKARTLLKEGVARAEAVYGETHQITLRCAAAWVQLESAAGRKEAAGAWVPRLEASEPAPESFDIDARTAISLALVWRDAGRSPDDSKRRAAALVESVRDTPVRLGWILKSLMDLSLLRRDWPAFETSVARYERDVRPKLPQTRTLDALVGARRAWAALRQGKRQEARELFEDLRSTLTDLDLSGDPAIVRLQGAFES